MERGAQELKMPTSEHYHGTESIIDVLERLRLKTHCQFNTHQKDQLRGID